LARGAATLRSKRPWRHQSNRLGNSSPCRAGARRSPGNGGMQRLLSTWADTGSLCTCNSSRGDRMSPRLAEDSTVADIELGKSEHGSAESQEI
jgi:hypothetical protein